MSKPIRILNMFTIMNRGGAETMVMNYYRNIDRSKVQFDFLVHRQERGAYDDEIEAMGGKIYRMLPIYPQNFNKYKKMLSKFFVEHKEYRIIHSHMSELGYFAFKEAREQGIPVRICHAHNAPISWDVKMIMRTYMKKMMIPYITHMFTCSYDSAVWLYGKKYENSFIQFNNAIDSSKFRYDYEKTKRIRSEFGLENKIVIGHVGRFNKQKNHERLLKIFFEIKRKCDNSVLVLVGDGDLKKYIEKRAIELNLKDSILFLGIRDDVDKIMQIFDVFLFPSLYEGLGIVLIEAQAAGVPCLTSAKVVPNEAKITDLLHFISLEKSNNEWAEQCISLIQPRYDTFDEIVAAKFDIKSNAKWLEEFYLNEYERTK